MALSSPPCPGLPSLAAGLQNILAGPVTVLSREANLYESTFPSEIVTCSWGDGRRARLFCKYTAAESNADYGHRGGPTYEAEVYRRVLDPLVVTVPHYYGAHRDDGTGRTWLILEYLEGAVLMDEADVAEAEVLAARWLGHFHAAAGRLLAADPVPCLTRYDMDYYLGWARRALAATRPWHDRFPWVAALGERLREAFTPLVAAEATVIHGEFYPLNILVRGGQIFPVDWESAAAAAGEIDLASLTEGWPEESARRCEREYRRTRWPGGAPAAAGRRLAAARLYLALRWLGDEPDADAPAPDPWYFDQLRAAGQRLGVIDP